MLIPQTLLPSPPEYHPIEGWLYVVEIQGSYHYSSVHIPVSISQESILLAELPTPGMRKEGHSAWLGGTFSKIITFGRDI
jgi:hypothetical protein